MREKWNRDDVSKIVHVAEDLGKDDLDPVDSNCGSVTELSSVERRAALASLAKFAKYTGPGIALLLASEQAAASGGGGFKPE